MATTEQDLASFTAFVRQRIDGAGSGASIDELFDQWRFENPSDELYAENVAAIKASIDDFQAGERGTPAGEHSAQLRKEFGFSKE